MVRTVVAIIAGFGASFVTVGFLAPSLPIFLPSISCFIGGFCTVTKADTSSIMLMIDGLLEVWESRWYFY